MKLTKQRIRSKILSVLKSYKEEDRKRKSRVIKTRLFRTRIFRKAKVVMFYLSFGGEVNTEQMIKEAKKLGKIIAVPVCKNYRIIKPCLLTAKSKLKKGTYGNLEPTVKNFIDLKNLDLVIVPGVAFDKKGNRLGRGKGCYDYFLKKLPPKIPSIGLAYNFQILPSIPTTKTDITVDRIIYS